MIHKLVYNKEDPNYILLRDCPVILITDFLILENCNFDIKLCWLKNTKNYQSIKIMINKMIV